MTSPFATSDDVEAALLRPLTDRERNYVPTLLDQASALLRTAAPSIDNRIAKYHANQADKSGANPVTVASVVAGIVKRYMVNPTGIASQADAAGPQSHSVSYALRSEKETRGALQVTSDDLSTLFPNLKRLRAGTIRTRAALAPRPVGRYGPPLPRGQQIDAVLTFARPNERFLDSEDPLILGEGI